MNTGKTPRYDLYAIVFVFLLAMALEYREAFSLIEDQTLSYRQLFRNYFGDTEKTSPSEDVVIVYTDEHFYDEYGKYPLTRTDLARLITALDKMGARVIGVDILLDFHSAYGEDPELAAALEKARNVLLVSQAEFSGGEFSHINTAIDEFEELTESGYSNITSNSAISESIVRLRIYEEIAREANAWPFAVKAASMYLDEEPALDDGVLTIGSVEVPLDQYNDMYIDYPRLPPAIDGVTTIPLHQVAGVGLPAGEILFAYSDAERQELQFLVENKIVLIGEVAEVAHDQFETPVGNVFGVEVIANEIATILRDGPLRAASLGAEVLLALIMMAAFIGTRWIQNPMPRNMASTALILVYIVGVSLIYVFEGLIFSMSYVLLASLLAMIVINARFYIAEMGQKKLIRDAFGQYLSPGVVADLVKDPDKLQLGGEEREMTAYFSDIRSFSTFSEKMTPTELVQALNEYLTEMCNIIIGYEGTIDKFEGDAIIAFWGAPSIQEDHARRSCLASIDMKKALVPMREKWLAEGRPSLHVRMGLNSGPMVVGNMGSAQRMNYTMMGDAVNLAARLEGANKAYGSDIMIAENTWHACQDHVDVRELDRIRVVGKTEPVTVYQLLERKNQTPATLADMVEQFHHALERYKAGDFQSALDAFQKCLEIVEDDGPSQVYVERCKAFIASPPPGEWDGVFSVDEKG